METNDSIELTNKILEITNSILNFEYMDYNLPRELAKEYCLKFNIHSPPTPIVNICNNLGFSCFDVENSDYNLLTKNKQIHVRKELSLVERRTCYAIGLWYCKLIPNEEIKIKNLTGHNFALDFAAEILIQEHCLLGRSAMAGRSKSRLAPEFKVPEWLMGHALIINDLPVNP